MLRDQLLERFSRFINHFSALCVSPSFSLPGGYFSWSCPSSAAWPWPRARTHARAHSSLRSYPSEQTHRSAAAKVNSTRFLPAVYTPLRGARILGEERLPNKPPRVYLNQLNRAFCANNIARQMVIIFMRCIKWRTWESEEENIS